MRIHGTRVIVTPSSFSSSANKKPDLHHSGLESDAKKAYTQGFDKVEANTQN